MSRLFRTAMRTPRSALSMAGLVITSLLLCGAPSRTVALEVTDSLKINEVHYAPAETPQETHEFIELFNAGSTTVYLDGVVITDEGNNGSNESTFQFPGTPGGTSWPVAPGTYVLLVPDAVGSPYAGIDFEFYAGGGDTDDLGVPNLVKTSGLATDMVLGNSGDGITLSIGTSTGNIIPCVEIVDGVSWGTGGTGDTTALSDSVCSDASPGGPATGTQSLARCGPGFDSDGSGDFQVLTRTPGVDNNCPAAPQYLDQSYAPCIPQEIDPVDVESSWFDANDDIESVWVYYRDMVVASFDSLLMTPTGDSTYSATLPGFADLTVVEYYFVATDTMGTSTTGPASGTLSYHVGFVEIVDIQFPTLPDSCASSMRLGQAANVTGVVTHVAREFDDFYFYIQQDTVPNSGLRIATTEVFLPEMGDSIVAAGLINEYMCQTQLEVFAGCFSIVGNDADFMARVLSDIEDVEQEENESMLVTIPGPIPVHSAMIAEVHEGVPHLSWQVGPELDPVWIGTDTFAPDSIFYSTLPYDGMVLDAITGIVALRESYLVADPDTRLRLEPRRNPDVDVNYTHSSMPIHRTRLLPNHPNPFNPWTTVSFELQHASAAQIDVFDVAGQRVRQLVTRRDFPSGVHRVRWNGRNDRGVALPSGVYLVRLEAAGTLESRKVHLLR